MGKNGNWIQKDDGWHKVESSQTQGNADYFSRPAPPVRDAETGHPIAPDGKIDWARVLREINEKE